jgi:general secretion pathway protein C
MVLPSMVFSLKKLASVQTALVSLLSAAALVLLCAVLANLTWFWLAPQVEAPAPAAPQGSTVLQAAYGLFGATRQTQTTVAPTGIALRLLGIVAATGNEAGYAVVMLGPGAILAVREGEEFAPGVRLVEVETARLILERNGSRETLTWPPR